MIRKANGWSQTQLGEKLGVTQATVSNWERGKVEIPDEVAAQVKALHGRDPSQPGPGFEGFETSAETEPPKTKKEKVEKKEPKKKGASSKNSSGATIGCEAQFWQMAEALRGSTDAGEYKHVVLGLIFLKYISDAFEEIHARLDVEKAQGADPEDTDKVFQLRVTECVWAKVFRDAGLGGQVGHATVCNMDYYWPPAFNANFKMERDKTLMQGDDYCNHRYLDTTA